VPDNGNRHGIDWLSPRHANGYQHRHRNDHGHGYYGQHWHRNDDEPAAHHDATSESAAASLDTRKRSTKTRAALASRVFASIPYVAVLRSATPLDDL
jgi:hypothetical protein